MIYRLALVAALSAVVPIPAASSGQPATAALEARRLSDPLTVDGHLDEAAWRGAEPAAGFEQIIPDQGGPPAWPTSVRVLFDDEFLYFGFEMGDEPGRRPRVTDLRRDFDYDESDLVGVFLDPFGDGRLGWGFQVTPAGTLRDLQITDGERIDQSWDAIWSARVATTPSGWSVEMAIPWKSLRYPEQRGSQTWRVNFQRRLRADNQLVGWSPWPRSLNPYRTELAGTLSGLEPPRPSRNLRLTPAVVARGRDDGDGWSTTADLSADVKWVPRPDLVLDATVNTDFAETEVDEQVVNLNRYSVFLPEKRSFFLEAAGVFDPSVTTWIQPFTSRRIGLDSDGTPIDLDLGARAVWQSSPWNFGFLGARTGAGTNADASSIVVLRGTRTLDSGSIGAIGTLRIDETTGGGSVRNGVVGVDWLLRRGRYFMVDALVTASSTDGSDWAPAGAFWVSYRPPGGYLGWLQYLVSPEFDPRVGFVARRNLILTSPAARLDWRPDWKPASVRNFQPAVTAYVYHSWDGFELQDAEVTVTPIDVRFDNGAAFAVSLIPTWQVVDEPFDLLDGMTITPTEYRSTRRQVSFNTNRSQPLFAAGSVTDGGFYDGDLRTSRIEVGTRPTPKLTLTASWSHNRLSDVGNVDHRTTDLWRAEVRAAPSPRFEAVAVWQRNTVAGLESWNLRMSWEPRPLTRVILVLDEVDEDLALLEPVRGRRVALKVAIPWQL